MLNYFFKVVMGLSMAVVVALEAASSFNSCKIGTKVSAMSKVCDGTGRLDLRVALEACLALAR